LLVGRTVTGKKLKKMSPTVFQETGRKKQNPGYRQGRITNVNIPEYKLEISGQR
jgi:hypothetical protein